MKNLRTFESLGEEGMKHIKPMDESDLSVEKPVSKEKVTEDNVDELTFKAYIDRAAGHKNPKGGKFPGVLYGTLPEINDYAEDNGLTWMSVFDNGYSYASEEPTTYEGFRDYVIRIARVETAYLSSKPQKTVLHHSNT